MKNFKELLNSIETLKLGEYTALNFSSYLIDQIESHEDVLTQKECYYLGYFMGNLPVIISCKDSITEETMETNETIKEFEKVMTEHNLWDDFDDCIEFTRTQLEMKEQTE